MILLTLFVMLRQDVQDACAGFPSNATARAIHLHWCDRVKYLEDAAPLWEHRHHEYQRQLEYARNQRWYWDKVTDVQCTTYSWSTRRLALNDLRERGLYRD